MNTKILAIGLFLIIPGISDAGCYGDYCSARQRTERITESMLERNYTVDQIGRARSDIMWPVYETPHPMYPVNPDSTEIVPLTPEQQAALDKFKIDAAALQDPNSTMNQTIFGVPGGYVNPNQPGPSLDELNQRTVDFINNSDRQLHELGYK